MATTTFALPPKAVQRRRVALVAHDNKKADLLDWVAYNRGTLQPHDLIATGTTGELIAERLGLETHAAAERRPGRRPAARGTDSRRRRRRADLLLGPARTATPRP